jgi:signal recognition particle subunit SRP54
VRIANGSGTSVSEVNQLVQRFSEARKMMSQMARGGGMPGMPPMPGMPGMPGMGGGGRGSKPKKGKKGKKGQPRRSGNPAKRAQQESGAESSEGRSEPTLSELPTEFTDLLGR